MNDDDMDKALLRQNLAEVVLVMKNYEKKPHTRRWKLKRLPVEEDLGNKAKGEEARREDECAKFLLELEREPELKFGINLNKNKDYRSEMASTIGDDVRTVPIEDLSLGDDEEDEDKVATSARPPHPRVALLWRHEGTLAANTTRASFHPPPPPPRIAAAGRDADEACARPRDGGGRRFLSASASA
jgi:hypothetical protein